MTNLFSSKGLIISLFAFLGYSLSVQAQAQWIFQNTGFNFILTGITFPGNQDSVGYAVGMSSTYNGTGIILKTTDAGNTWVQLNTGSLPGLESVSFTSLDTGYIGGWQNYFAKTTNGGLTWTTSTVNANIWYIKEIEFFDSQKGIVVAAGSQAFVTNNGGASWTAASGFINAEDVTFANADVLYAVGGDEKIARSINGGLNWNTIYSGTFQNVFLGVDFFGLNHGMVVGEDGKVLTTVNGGNSWTVGNVGSTHLLRVSHLFDSLNFMAAGTPEGVFKSNNGGQSWVSDYQGGNNFALYSAAFTPAGNGFICGSQGRILKRMAVVTAAFSVNNDSICRGDSVLFTQNSQGNLSSWNWVFAGGTPATFNGPQPPAIYYAAAGNYDVQLIVGNTNTTDTLLLTSAVRVFDVNQPIINGSGMATAGDTSTYEVASMPNHTYYWQALGGQIISGQSSRQIRVYWPQGTTGQVNVVVTNQMGCSNADSLQILVSASTSSVHDLEAWDWQLYPNPAGSWLEVSWPSTIQTPVNARIFDTSGRKLAEMRLENTRISIEQFPAGMYFLELQYAEQAMRRRFVKQ